MAVSDFLFSTDYVQDKAIYLKSASFTIPQPTAGYYYTVAHGLSFTPLVGGSWSTTPDFSITYNFGTGVTPSTNINASLFNYYLDIAADATNIYVIPSNVSGSAQSVYIRIFGVEPSDSLATITSTSSQGDLFVFSTDYNYTKPFLSSKITGLSASSVTTIPHNLGYYPQVTCWSTNSARVFGSVFLANVRYPITNTDFIGGTINDVNIEVTSTAVNFITGSSSNTNRIDYIIYYDKSGVF
jgi:hypothetical protein